MTDQTAAIEVWARVLCAADAHVHGYPTWQQLPTAPGPSGRSQDDYRKVAAWLLPRMTVADPAEQAPDTEERAARWETAALKAGREVDRNALRVYMAVADDEQAELRRMADEAQQPETQPEDPARIDRLRPEFFEHASFESIDSQIRRAETQQRQWGNRVQTLAILRQARVMQKELGEQPAVEAQQPKEARS